MSDKTTMEIYTQCAEEAAEEYGERLSQMSGAEFLAHMKSAVARGDAEITEELRDLREAKKNQETFGVKDFATEMAMKSALKRERELLLEQARALVKRFNVPATLEADWDKSNHYELTNEANHLGRKDKDFFWLDVESVFFLPEALIDCGKDFSATEEGKRLGYALESAALLPKLVAALEFCEIPLE